MVLFVEVFRLFVAVCGALVGLAAGNHYAATPLGRSTGAAIGVLVGYVVGGVVGRLTAGGMNEANRSLRDVPAPELLSGMLFGSLGLLIGVIVCIPLFVFVKEDFDFLIAAAVAWVLATLGLKLGMAKGRQLADALGVTRHLTTSRQDISTGADLADTSAVMDRSFLVMGQIGLFGPELLIPEPVADELTTLADGPDPVAARRARRGLEALDELKKLGVKVTFLQSDVPAAASIEDKVCELADRLDARVVTCSVEMTKRRQEAGARVLDLRRLVTDLSPDHIPGEHLRVDLIRAGRQPQQAIGFLPDGDMVVVNDAEEMVGRTGVEVVVLSTRPTNQGLLVFARVADETNTFHGSGRHGPRDMVRHERSSLGEQEHE
ncbi:MAG: hypothetical protein ACLPUG_17530 [Acidimicrobiales bacterium]|jgi:uncharacterized protein YacL